MKTTTAFAFLSLTLFCASTAHAVTIDFAQVGNAGNAADTTGYGAVSYNYAISKTEVTNSQYTEFLNGVAATDPYGLYNTFMGSSTRAGIIRSNSSGNYTYAVKADAIGVLSGGSDYTYGDKPVNFVSWYDSIRFTNWLHNGQGSGDTETGAYTLGSLGAGGVPVAGDSITRNADATYWLPSEDEWYKAAYHDASAGTAGTYYDYATGANIPNTPDNNLPSADTGNSANFFDGSYTTGTASYPLTDAGVYTASVSSYGTYDQNGNLWEWNETLISSSARGLRGGGWGGNASNLPSSFRFSINPISEISTFGFRVASIPEPSTALLGALAAVGFLMRRRRLS